MPAVNPNPQSGGGSSSGNAYTARVSGLYYYGGPLGTNLTSTATPDVTRTCWLPQIFEEAVQLSEFGLTVTTGGGNAQIALYARSSTTGDATGVCLAKTGNIDTSTTGNKSGPLTGGSLVSGGIASIPAGEYMWGIQFDNTSVRCVIPGTSDVGIAIQNGSTTLAALASGASTVASARNLNGGTFGTWPDVTGATFAQDTGFRGARPLYKVA